MAYGTVKVDTIVFTSGGSDETITVSGVAAGEFSGGVTASGEVTGTAFVPTSSGVPTNGIYLPAANSVGISTNGVGRLFIDENGTLLVGGTSTAISSGGLEIKPSSAGGYLALARNDATVFADNAIGTISWSTNDPDGTYQECARIYCAAQAVHDVNNKPSYLDFYTNGGSSAVTHRMRLTHDGKLGIGTTSPGAKLEVVSDSTSVVPGSFVSKGVSDGTTYLAGDALVLGSNDPVANNTVRVDFYANNGSTYTGAYMGIVAGSTANGPANIVFGQRIGTTTAQERARIDSSGRLLVGTSSSLSAGLIETAGTTFPTSAVVARNTGNDSNPTGFVGAKIRGTSIVQSGDRLVGFVGRGYDGSTYLDAGFVSVEVDGTPGANDMPGRLVFSTTADGASSPTERMRIQANGYITLGGGAASSQGVISIYPSYSSGSGTFIASTPLAYWNRVNSTSQGTACLFQNGGVTAGTITYTNTATAYNTSSDYRLKENVVPMAGAADRLKQLKPSQFNFIADPGKTVDGFLAHEAQAVVPECVTGTKDEVDGEGNPVYQGIDQSKLVPLLTAALQEAIGRIETLEAEVAALKAS